MTPFAGAYCSSKAAVHSLTDALRMELAPFRIRVVTIQPGGVRSSFGQHAEAAIRLPENSIYKPAWRKAIRARAQAGQQGATPAEVFVVPVVGSAVAQLAAAGHPGRFQQRATATVEATAVGDAVPRAQVCSSTSVSMPCADQSSRVTRSPKAARRSRQSRATPRHAESQEAAALQVDGRESAEQGEAFPRDRNRRSGTAGIAGVLGWIEGCIRNARGSLRGANPMDATHWRRGWA